MGGLCCRKISSCQYAPEQSQCNCFDSMLRFSPRQTRISESRLTSSVGVSQGYVSACTKDGHGSLKSTHFRGQFPLHMAPCTHKHIWQFSTSIRLSQLAEHVTKNTQRQHPEDINANSFKQLCQRVMDRSRRKGASEHSQDLFLKAL